MSAALRLKASQGLSLALEPARQQRGLMRLAVANGVPILAPSVGRARSDAIMRTAGNPRGRRRAERDQSRARRRARGERRQVAWRDEQAASVLIASPIPWCQQHWVDAIGAPCAVLDVADVASLEQIVAKMKPDVVLVDQALLGQTAEDGAGAIQRLAAETRVLVLAKNPDDNEALIAFKAGAHAYCDRNIDVALLAKAVKVVQKGEIWIGRGLIARLVEELAFAARRVSPQRSEFATRLEGISERQRQVLDLLRTGASNKEIACQLNVTTRTIKAHLGAIFEKVGICGRVRLTAALLEHSRITAANEASRGRTRDSGRGLRDVGAKEVASRRPRSAAV
jgi:DNA-binding NarL/FixJ family response regulator